MDLNFRGTKLSRIETFRVFRVFIFADGVPQYYIEYIDYISVLICVSHTVWTLIFAVLNFRGFHGSTAIRESLGPWKFRPALTGKRITSILMNSYVII